MTTITPIDDSLFSLDVLHEAARLARTDVTQLTDLHLRHWAVYDAGGATRLAQKRAAAVAAKEASTAGAAFAPTAHAKGRDPYITQSRLHHKLKIVLRVVAETLAEDVTRPLGREITGLRQQVGALVVTVEQQRQTIAGQQREIDALKRDLEAFAVVPR